MSANSSGREFNVRSNWVHTFEAAIYCGLRRGYDGHTYSVRAAIGVCRDYCEAVKLGVSVTETTFIYPGGQEPGVIVGLFNYPRFPSKPSVIKAHARDLAIILMRELEQERLTIVCSDESRLIEREDAKEGPNASDGN